MLSKFYGYIVALGALVVAILAALGLAKRAGKKEEQAAEVKQALTDSKDANVIDDKVHNLSDAALDKRLSEFTRQK